MNTSSTHPPLLEFRQARYDARAGGLEVTLRLDLELLPRKMMLVKLDRQPSIGLFADACCGLVRPAEGTARFMGRDWSAASADEANAMRGTIGRVFSRGAWLSYLSVADNVLIQQMHHTRRPVDELRREAAGLAQSFGLPGLPMDSPRSLSTEDLQRAGLVRAFLGRPRLVVLEQPFRETADFLPALVTAVIRAQEQGAAVLWLAYHLPATPDLLERCDQRLRIRQSGQMETVS